MIAHVLRIIRCREAGKRPFLSSSSYRSSTFDFLVFISWSLCLACRNRQVMPSHDQLAGLMCHASVRGNPHGLVGQTHHACGFLKLLLLFMFFMYVISFSFLFYFLKDGLANFYGRVQQCWESFEPAVSRRIMGM